MLVHEDTSTMSRLKIGREAREQSNKKTCFGPKRGTVQKRGRRTWDTNCYIMQWNFKIGKFLQNTLEDIITTDYLC